MLTSLVLLLLATVSTAAPVQWVTSCQGADARLDRLADAVEHGDISVVRAHLDSGADVGEMWRDSRNPMLCRSLLLRSIWYGQEEIFRLLLQRGADPLSLPRESLQGPVREGRVEIVRTLFELGLKPHDNEPCDVVKLFGLFSRNQDGCEGAIGPLWLHFVLTGRHRMVEFMIENGADLSVRSEVWDGGRMRPFTAMEVAARRKDQRMMDLLRRAGAPAL